MYREIVGPNWEPLPLSEELLVLGNLPAADDAGFKDAPSQLHSYNPKATPPASGYDWQGPLSAQLPAQGNFPVDPPGIGRWPRRLLWMSDIPGEMLSLAWKPGNVYTGTRRNGADVTVREPRYNAISYTWGRYWLDPPNGPSAHRRHRHVRGIGVDGVTWDVPRIDPARFNVERFEKVLRKTCEMGPERCLVWVDVACIDQKDEAVRGLEIGRQAVIFENAVTVTVWLHEHDATTLKQVFETLDTHDNTNYLTDAQPLHEALDTLFKDTWFTSTWTLQEAFLARKHAIFLSKDGQSIPGFTLGRFVEICSEINDRIEQHSIEKGYGYYPTPERTRKQFQEIRSMIESRGLLALAQNSPFALYSASRSRQSFSDWDKVYGIQQVFGFRVGNTIQGTNPKVNYNRITLEAQLGALMLCKYPVQSQLHIFAEPVEPGRGWHISLSSKIPRFNLSAPLNSFEFTSLCNLRAVDDSDRQLPVARGEGETCPFAMLWQDWRDIDGGRLAGLEADFRSNHQISLDAVRPEGRPGQAKEKPEYRTWGYRQDIKSGRAQHALACWMAELFKHDGLIVLRLGSFVDPKFGEHFCGLILAGNGAVKKRIGVCIWELSRNAKYAQEHLVEAEVYFE